MRFQSPFLHAIACFYNFFIRFGGNLQSLFLLYMRVTWGHQLIIFGWEKLHSIEKTAGFFASLHISNPYFSAYLTGWVELLGGICLIVGLASRVASIPLIIIMLMALSTAHAPEISGFRFLFEPLSLVRQAPYPFLITALLVFIFGPGRISLDAWLKRWSERQPKY